MSSAPGECRWSLRAGARARFHSRAAGGAALGLLALAAGCAGAAVSGGASASLVADRRAELEGADRAWSAAASNVGAAAGIGAMLADDVRFLQDGEPIVRGRAAAIAALERGSDADVVQTWTPTRVDVSADGGFGYSYGYYELGARGGEPSPALAPGKYVAVWRRDADGTWRAVAYVRSPRAPGEAWAAPTPELAALVARADAQPASRSADAHGAAMEADRRFAAMAATAGVGAAFEAFAAPDGVLLGGGPALIVGPTAIRAAFSGRPAGASLDWHPVDGLAADAGDLAFTVGEAESRDPATGNAGFFKYLTVWRRQPDGRWLYVVDGGNARPAPSATRGPTTGSGGR